MTYYQISKSDIRYNYHTVCDQTDALVVPMIKAGGYGMGAQAVLELLEAEGAHVFAVSRLEEALALQTESKLWVLTCYREPEEIEQMITRGYSFSVDSLEQCRLVSQIAERLQTDATVHFAIETGFGRFGFFPDAIDDIEQACKLPHITAEGIFSHCMAAFYFNDDSADKQLECFLQVVHQLEERGLSFKFRHIANSSCLPRDPKFHLDAVRIGSALCGRLPVPLGIKLKKVGKLYSHIVEIRTLPAGHNIGYGRVYRLKRQTRVAVLPVGSIDGVGLDKEITAFRFRDFVRHGVHLFKLMLRRDIRKRVLVNGHSVPVLGFVALTHTMIDVTDVDCKVGDAVEIPISPLYVADHIERRYEE